MSLRTTDLCDAYPERVQPLTPLFHDYGGRRLWHGEIATVKVFEDNSRVREALEEAGRGRVLVVDGGGSMRCALVGDRIGAMAAGNGWAGVLVYGCIRDSVELAGIDLGVKALNTHPQRSLKKGVGERDVSVTFAGVTLSAGEWLYADEDGVIVADGELPPAE